MDALIDLRKQFKNLTDVKITYMPFFIKAMSIAIFEYPIINSTIISENEYALKASHNISFAMDTPAGLLVPNIKNCENKSIIEIAREMNKLQTLGAKGKISQEDLAGGTICFSNIGTVGGTYMSPIILAPQVVIGACGTIRPRLEKVNGEIVENQILCTSWSADHRIIDGGTIGRFVAKWKEVLENPSLMLLHLK